MAASHVLVPLDGSPLADEAFRHALELFDCRVTVLNVVTPIDAAMSEGGILEPGEDRRENARDRADRIVERARASTEADRPRSQEREHAEECGGGRLPDPAGSRRPARTRRLSTSRRC